ncbi:metal ABC transporter ATP-binding protein [Anaerosalibacter bizertensis]|uniref:Metal ABC transporter ATP-binding protein n=1 Tax=Anaerosalibacter bizertensis TaxID=932217 RepID=A0A844FHT9_9FIRM|nr:metal ABC transporter ATP-binding protein [Anaerosalibacter bizertensis]MBV1818616.1 metal ABC transporter ATP-binding protein [Bacteroidales bacterium MSK.15.36]HHV26272.1 metal ABC transporter ATP-binding protein [Tissierellia bacterium]MBU5294741.1 metal ABC transporter ATP-binding protein [Anaerosalibacter bizertensis]MCB5558685.1 metal ABC transporter ATP-binding protein [Anaerosalibacter bizertensis]MCG4565802.1 metal ABC transporter ATP-binding protein [Anaerosalibacter bizertensis]
MQEKIVEFENISFSYGKNEVLDNINFYIEKGDFIGIIGPNGSAKSTLMKVMIGILKPDKGRVRLFNEDIKDFKDFTKVGYISQNVRDINPRFPATVEEIVESNLYSQLGFLKISNKNIKEKTYEVLRIVGMEEYKDTLIGKLSGGQKQRVFIARSLINNPEILFMDEPLVGIDIGSQKKLYSLMDKLNKDYNITLAMVSHDIGTIKNRANKIFILGNKKLYVHDSDKIKSEDLLKEIYNDDLKV